MHKLNLPQKAAVLTVAFRMLAVVPVSEASWRLDEDPNLTEPRNFRMTSGGRPVEREGIDLTKDEAEPPGRLCFSSSSVFSPALEQCAAAARPPLPAPITMTS